MVKALKVTTRKTIKQLEKGICKHKSLRVNLKEFVQKLHKKHQNITTKQYLVRIHNFINNFKTMGKGCSDMSKPTYDFVRVCVGCNQWGDRSQLIECNQCEDFYHLCCVNTEVDDPATWMCHSCVELAEYLVNRDSKLNRYYSSKAQSGNKKCANCKIKIQSKSFSCTRCSQDYHEDCLGSKRTQGVCSACHIIIKEEMAKVGSLSQKTLFDYYEVQENGKGQVRIYEKEQSTTTVEELTVFYSYILNLKAPIGLSQNEVCRYKSQLIYAILSKNMNYSQELVFETKLPQGILYQDPTLNFLQKQDQDAYREYKKQPIGPYRLQLIEGMGYDVKADKPIPKGTIICQYVGQVITKRNALQYLQNDSLMQLSIGMNADTSLIIKPQKYTNIARFINGANNSDPHRNKKINVESSRFAICGRPTLLLFAKREIEKGESLIYDYNAGGLGMYETEGFS